MHNLQLKIGILVFFLFTSNSFAGERFVLTQDTLQSVDDPARSVRIGERLPIFALKDRFHDYAIESTAGEDCAFCAWVTRPDVSFLVNYDNTGVVVTSILCSQGCSDALGNEVGTNLRLAIGQVGDCLDGMYTACRSPKLNGLSYIVEEAANCPIEVSGDKTAIPECTKIEAIEIDTETSSN